MKAPDFPEDLDWINTGRRLSMADFRGKFVLLDFWTYCCINCMHVIPDLVRLEEKYPQLVVIGVHSAKFRNESVRDNVEQAVLRYGISHPVLMDNDFRIWKIYGVSSWPSFVFIAPDGEVIGKASGEGIFERLDPLLTKLIPEYERMGLLRDERLAFETLVGPDTFLSFPGKIAADPIMRRLMISDSNHNRIVVATLDGRVTDIVGNGMAGSSDGPFEEASFSRPQGLDFDAENGRLYVADTENHLVRRVDMIARTVSTVAGTGSQGTPLEREGKGKDISLSSPWDLTIEAGYLYVANAGTHQIWRISLDDLDAEVYAGTGKEALFDGLVDMAALAQPSGITAGGNALYFVDSEASALREIEDGLVTTLIGAGLFEFGDVDGPFEVARLQHPIGVHFHEGLIYVADSYNHKVKVADPESGSIQTLIGDGLPGQRDGPARQARLKEPGGLVFFDGLLYVADTNNHAVRVYDPGTGEVSTLELVGDGPGNAGSGEGCAVCGPGLEMELGGSKDQGRVAKER